MEKKSELSVLDNRKPSHQSISRREWLERMVGGAAAGAAFPALGAAHPIRKHLMSAATVEKADAQAAAAEWAPEFLDPHQVATLTVLAERMVPGSTEAQSARFMDTLLAVESREEQQRFMNSLSAFEGEALQRFQHPFKDLTQAQQNEILTAASAAPTGEPGRPGPRRRGAFGPPAFGAAQEPVTLTLHDHFESMKGWVSGAYYSSEVGMKELGWTGEVMFESFPGCQHPGGHA